MPLLGKASASMRWVPKTANCPTTRRMGLDGYASARGAPTAKPIIAKQSKPKENRFVIFSGEWSHQVEPSIADEIDRQVESGEIEETKYSAKDRDADFPEEAQYRRFA